MTSIVRQDSVAVRDIDMAYAEWGDVDSPIVLLAHATGFHGRCWDSVVRCLGGGVRVLAPDLRGHGSSTKNGPYNDMREFASDLAAFVEALELIDVLAVGHSMGGLCMVLALGFTPDRFRKLLLVDPIIKDPEVIRSAPSAPSIPVEKHPVARRRNEWASPEEMFKKFADRDPFRFWQRDALMDYCRYGLVRKGDAFVLACPPAVEASIYIGTAGRDLGDVIAGLPHETVVLRARRDEKKSGGKLDFSGSQTWPGLADALPNGSDVYLPELTHYMPMQDPELVATYIREML